MHEAFTRKRAKGFEACTGCSLCLLACPVWRATHDIRLTPHGRAKAMQHGATASDLAASMDSCTLCGACEPACPEDIALVDMIAGLRASAAVTADDVLAPVAGVAQEAVTDGLIPDAALAADADLLAQAAALLGGIAVVTENGADIALALEAGMAIAPARREAFLAPLRKARRLVVADGILLRALRGWLPGVRVEGFGEAASRTAAVRANLGKDDFYVIEPRAYHAERERLVGHYDGLRHATGCGMNLDMQRLAIPTTANSLPQRSGRNRVDVHAQARWILEGNNFSRIVVEDLNDVAAFRAVTDKPVVHVSQVLQVTGCGLNPPAGET
jgi:heterodisulfide reductase subunit C